MSGIAGVFFLDDRPVSRHLLDRMTAPIAHRGKDASDSWFSGSVAISQLVTRISPQSRTLGGPIRLPDAGVTVVADAVLDNRPDLFGRLSMKESDAVTDQELIGRLYARYGEDLLDHLEGDFIFALWDEPKRRLLVARDALGVVPFYYFYLPGRVFAFASEAKCLLPVPGNPLAIDPAKVADHLANLYGDLETTIYQGVKRLPPAQYMTVSPDGLSRRQYWQLERIDIPQGTDQSYADEFGRLFTEAVRCRLDSPHPVGSQLSGGLDSSYVACVARDVLKQQNRGPLYTFSTDFEKSPVSSERLYMDAVLETGGFHPHFQILDDVGPITTAREEYAYFDDLAAGAHFMVWNSFRAASDAGVRILLDGVDGDTTVDHGYFRFRELAQAGDWQGFRDEVVAFASWRVNPTHMQPFERSVSTPDGAIKVFAIEELDRLAGGLRLIRLARALQGLKKGFPGINMPFLVNRSKNQIRQALLGKWKPKAATGMEHDISLVGPELRRLVHIEDRVKAFGSNFFEENDVRAYQLGLFRSNIIVAALEPTSHAAAAFGLQVRHPFFDRRLIQYCVSLPSQQSLKHGWNRWILRKAMDGVVPDIIRHRIGKANMEPVFDRALRVVDRELLDEYRRHPGALEPYISITEYERISGLDGDLQGYDLDRTDKIASLSLLLEHCQSRLDGIRSSEQLEDQAPVTRPTGLESLAIGT